MATEMHQQPLALPVKNGWRGRLPIYLGLVASSLLLLCLLHACAKGGGILPEEPLKDAGANSPAAINAAGSTGLPGAGTMEPSAGQQAEDPAALASQGYCGDGVVNAPEEQCDQADLGDLQPDTGCESLGEGTGTLICDTAYCTYSIQFCSGPDTTATNPLPDAGGSYGG